MHSEHTLLVHFGKVIVLFHAPTCVECIGNIDFLPSKEERWIKAQYTNINLQFVGAVRNLELNKVKAYLQMQIIMYLKICVQKKKDLPENLG